MSFRVERDLKSDTINADHSHILGHSSVMVPLGGGTYVGDTQLKYTKVGSLATLSWEQMTGTVAGVVTSLVFGGSIPTEFRPIQAASGKTFVVGVINNAAFLSSAYLVVSAAGGISLLPGAAAFVAGTLTLRDGAVSWITA